MSTRPRLSSAMTRIKAHMMTQIIRSIQLFYFYVSLIQLSGGVWPLCAHGGWWPLMRFPVVGTDVLILSLFWLQPGDGDGEDTGFTPRPKRSLKLKPSRGRMKRANQSKNQQSELQVLQGDIYQAPTVQSPSGCRWGKPREADPTFSATEVFLIQRSLDAH